MARLHTAPAAPDTAQRLPNTRPQGVPLFGHYELATEVFQGKVRFLQKSFFSLSSTIGTILFLMSDFFCKKFDHKIYILIRVEIDYDQFDKYIFKDWQKHAKNGIHSSFPT